MHMWASGRNHGSAKPNAKAHRWFESNHVLEILKCGGMVDTAVEDKNVYRLCKLTAAQTSFRVRQLPWCIGGSSPSASTKKFGTVFDRVLMFFENNYRDVVQLVERMVWDHEVAGSSPVIPTQDAHRVMQA